MIRAVTPLPEFEIPNPSAEVPAEAVELVAAMLLDLAENTERAESEH